MPKDKSNPNSSCSGGGVRFSPYSKNIESWDDKEDSWEGARCPICMEHPHNAVILICSSHENGCRPCMCDTSRRHSNCLDQFCKLHAAIPSKSTDDKPNKFVSLGGKEDVELVCPLCRGKISGWIVVDSARRYMNSKVRSCELEDCDFSGKYDELRKHTRLKHPLARPSETDKVSVPNWSRLGDGWEFVVYEDWDEEDEDDEWEWDEDHEGDEEFEVKLEPLDAGDDFLNHIHFGNENDTVIDEQCSITNGILTYTRTTTTGKSYEYATVLE